MTTVIALPEVSVTFGLPYDHVEPLPEAQLDQLLAKTKGRLFFKQGAGFLGSLLCDHEIFWDPTCRTAWCDGTRIGINPKFFTWLTPEERVTLVVHELWHTGYLHMDRRGETRCPDYWNQAADYVINNRMENDGFVFGEKLMSLGPCLDHQYDDMTTEQVYDLLAPPPFGKPSQQPDPSGQPGAQSNQSGADGNPLSGDVRQAPAGMKDKIIGKVIKAAQASRMSKEAGVVPGETELILDEFLNPILPWEILLQRWFTERNNDDYSWKRPSRRYEDEYLPSMLSDNGLEHMAYFWDISGSVGDEDILRSSSEVAHVHNTYLPQRTTVITFDTELHDFFEFTDEEPFENIKVTGRGGTDLGEVEAWIKKNRPTAAIIFSDLWCDPMKEDPGIPILWVVVGNPTAKVPFGQMIHIESEYS
jgi:predicted metal-dependent peptidase